MEKEARGNKKRGRVRTSRLQSSISQLTISCGMDGDFFWTTFLEALGKYSGSSRRLEEQENTGYRRAGRFEV